MSKIEMVVIWTVLCLISAIILVMSEHKAKDMFIITVIPMELTDENQRP